MDDLLLLLPRAEGFNRLPEAECAELVRLVRRRWLKAGAFLCHQGEVWPQVLFLVSGRLQWRLVSVGGQEYALATIEAEEVVWGHSMFDDQPMPASIVTTKPSDVCQWSGEVILPVLYRNPVVLWEVIKMQVRAMRRAREIIYGLAFQPVASRLAKLLLERLGSQENVPVERDLTLSEIAIMILSSPEVVCRLLYQFQSDGVLQITRAHIVLRDKEALARLVQMA